MSITHTQQYILVFALKSWIEVMILVLKINCVYSVWIKNYHTWILTTFSYLNYSGSLWNEPSAKSCVRQKQPVFGSTYPGGLPPTVALLKSVLSKITKPVTLLDITTLSLLRKDWHPFIYGLGGPTAMDCSHWCLVGVPDTWNEILYNLILWNWFMEISIEISIHFFTIHGD